MKLRSQLRLTTLVVFGVVVAGSLPAMAADWRQFRGPGGAGIATEAGLPTTWGAAENIKWQVSVPGEGWACPIVVGNQIFLATAVSEGGKNRESNTRWELLCYDATTGDKLWTKLAAEGKPRVGTHRDNTYASETPATDGKRIVTYFGMTGIYCFDLQGELKWEKDLGAYDMRNDWGTSSSPVLHDDLVFVQVDNEEDSFIVALDASSGAEKWRKPRDETSNWGTPIIWKNSVRTELVTSGGTVRSYDPQSGELLWSVATGASRAISSPMAVGDTLIVGASNRRAGGGLFAIEASASGDLAEENTPGVLWTNAQAAPAAASPLLYEGYVYIFGRRGGIVTCLDAETGERVYRERLPQQASFWTSPFAYEGKIFCLAENGTTHVLKAGAEYESLKANELEGRFWSTPAIANGSLYIRSVDTLFCIGD